MTNYLLAALLGIIEGLTEFLPVSSTGHLILFIDLLGFDAPKGRSFEIIIQLGAVLSVIFAYWPKIRHITFSLHNNRASQHFAIVILLAFLPAMVLGAAFGSKIKEHLFSPTVVGAMLVIGGIIMLIVEHNRPQPTIETVEEMDYRTALKIGVFQCLAMVPGVSRSGATIIGALLLRVQRPAAAEFSFFLAIPTMLGATAYAAYKARHEMTADGMGLIAVGFIAAFLTGLLVVKSLLAFVSRYGFAPFAYYRILIGSFVLALLFLK